MKPATTVPDPSLARAAMPPTAVLFGFDGVLADVENVHVVAWQRTLSRLGWEAPDDVAARAAAMDDRGFAAETFARRGAVDADLDGWVRAKRELTARMIGLNPRPFPGVVPLVRALAGRVRLAIVADDRREDVDAFLAATRLTDAFELVVAAGDAPSPPPAPDALLAALTRLGVAAAEAVAVAASPPTLAAAVAAGVPSVAVGHRLEAGGWSAGATFVPDLEPPADALAALGFDDRSAS